MAPTTAAAIADYFIHVANETGSFISNLKLQKLVYYAQAWHLAVYNAPLFDEDFEAWVHGPVIPTLYQKYKQFGWKPIDKQVEQPNFSKEVQELLDEVADEYFGCDAFELELMTHQEDPWIMARNGLPKDEPSNAIIPKPLMGEYYRQGLGEENQQEECPA